MMGLLGGVGEMVLSWRMEREEAVEAVRQYLVLIDHDLRAATERATSEDRKVIRSVDPCIGNSCRDILEGVDSNALR